MMKNITSLSIVIPAYNEEERILQSLHKIIAFVEKEKIEYEIIIADDGSSDGTRAIVEDCLRTNKNIRLTHKRKNRGKGYTVREGMLLAKKKYCLFSDADLSTPIHELKKFDKFAAVYSMVIGTRTKDSIKVKQPFIRIFAGRVFSIIVKTASGLSIDDTQCGFKMLERKAVKRLFGKMKIDGWAFDVELLHLAKKHKVDVKVIPIAWRNDVRSKVKFTAPIRMFFEVLKIRRIHKN
jgi:dolichyl-phosphate beta-glucosyltransferase